MHFEPMPSNADGADVEQFRAFLRDRFRTEAEALSFFGGVQGHDGILNVEELPRALRMAGYTEPTNRLVLQFGEEGRVRVADLVEGAGLPLDPPQTLGDYLAAGGGAYGDISRGINLGGDGIPAMVPSSDGYSLQAQVEELRSEVSRLRASAENAASRDMLHEERANTDLNHGSLRQLSAKLEESLARETVALRADNADLRSSLTEAMRLLAAEKKERQADTAEATKRHKEFHHSVEERTTRLENLMRGVEAQAAENKRGIAEVEQLRDMTELRALAAVAEEGRTREAALAQEKQERESKMQDQDARWKTLLGEERQLRTKEHGSTSAYIGRVEDSARNDREMMLKQISELMARSEDLAGDIRNEGRQRQAELSQHQQQHDSLRDHVSREGQDRRERHEELAKRHLNLNDNHKENADKLSSDLALLKQSCLDLRSGLQLESSTREEGVTRLQQLLNDEVRAREEAVVKSKADVTTLGDKLEHHWRSLVGQEKSTREEALAQVDARLAAIAHEHNFDKAKVSAQNRELATGMAQLREAIANEVSTRRQDDDAVKQAVQELRDHSAEEKALLDQAEARLQQQLHLLDQQIRQENKDREANEKGAQRDVKEVKDGLAHMRRRHEDLDSSTAVRFEDEKKAREQGHWNEAKQREDAIAQHFGALDGLLKEHKKEVEDAHHKIHQRGLELDQAHASLKDDHHDHKRKQLVNAEGLGDQLEQVRKMIEENARGVEGLQGWQQALEEERVARNHGEASLEKVVKEQQIRVEQLGKEQANNARKIADKLVVVEEALKNEAQARAVGDAENEKLINSHRDAHIQAHNEHARGVEDTISRAIQPLHDKHEEEKAHRLEAATQFANKAKDLREATDDVKRWRSEQYNDIVAEVSKVAEMVAEEAKARQQQDQLLAGEVTRLQHGALEETNARKVADSGAQQELTKLLERLEAYREAFANKEKEQWKVIEGLRNEAAAESHRRETADAELKEMFDRNHLEHREVMDGAARAWQKANTKTGDEWRQALRTEVQTLEKATERLEQEVVETRTAAQEARATAEQVGEDARRRHKAATEALAVEESARQQDDVALKQIIDELRADLGSERAERGNSEQHTADRFVMIETALREEPLIREEGEKRLANEILELAARLQAESANREDVHKKLEQTMSNHHANHADVIQRERGLREEGHAKTQDTLQARLEEETAAREADRKAMLGMLQQAALQAQQEREERIKADRSLQDNIARTQSMQKEEEESRAEQGERLSSSIESLQEVVRGLGPQREAILKKCMEAVDQVRANLNKEVLARTSKSESIDESLRELGRRCRDEQAARELADKNLGSAIEDERNSREEALSRERRLAAEEVQKAAQTGRKAREEEERKLQERIMEVSLAVSQERDQRQEGQRQMQQKVADAREEMSREHKAREREVGKQIGNIHRHLEDHGNRSRDLDALSNQIADKCSQTCNNLAADIQRHDDMLQSLDAKHGELQKHHATTSKEHGETGAEIKRQLEDEIASINATIAMDRRAREAGDLQVATALKTAIREQNETREAGLAAAGKEIATVRAAVNDLAGKHDAAHGQMGMAHQSLRDQLTEVRGERKADGVAMSEALAQVSDEMKRHQGSRKDDLERFEGMLASFNSRLESADKKQHEYIIKNDQTTQLLGSELKHEADSRSALGHRLEALVGDTRRALESNLEKASKTHADALAGAEEASKTRLDEETRRTSALVDKVSRQLGAMGEDMNRDRAAHADLARDHAKNVATLQTSIVGEQQARQQGLVDTHQKMEKLRELLDVESKERRNHHSNHADEIAQLHRGLSLHGDKHDSLANRLQTEAGSLQDRLARQGRQHEAAMDQMRQRSLTFGTAPKEAAAAEAVGTPAAPPAPALQAGPTMAEWKEFQHQTIEDLTKQKRQIEDVMGDKAMLYKSVNGLTERADTLRNGLTEMQAVMNEVVIKQRAVMDVEAVVGSMREELRREADSRRMEDERLSKLAVEADQKLHRAEQQRIVQEESFRQDLVITKTALKKDMREQELAMEKLAIAVREESQKNEEAIKRESRLRQDSHNALEEAKNQAIREERHAREKAHLALQGRGITLGGSAKPGGEPVQGGELLTAQLDIRSLRQAVGETHDRLGQLENRQKSAEERTVSMLDAIMGGLTGPEDAWPGSQDRDAGRG